MERIIMAPRRAQVEGKQGFERKDNNISPLSHAAGDFPRVEGGGGGGGRRGFARG